MVNSNGIHVDPSRIEAVKNWKSSVKDKILAALCEVSKVENVAAEMLRGMDQLIKRKEDGDGHFTSVSGKHYKSIGTAYDIGAPWGAIGLPLVLELSQKSIRNFAKKSTTTMSSTEAEYISAAEAPMEAVKMWNFIDGLGGVMPSNKRPMEKLCDNEQALAIASVPEF
ncbi:hypothetical protein Tco_1011047 [Tanacetum coccineum]